MEAKQLQNLRFLSNPDEEIIQALVNLEGNDDFKKVLGWMLESSGNCDNILRNAESKSLLHRAQGAQSVILEFCERAASPREVMALMKRKAAGIHLSGDGCV